MTKRKRPEDRLPLGRPRVHGPEVRDAICRRIAGGESLRGICRDPKMPDKDTVLDWLEREPDFAARYARARVAQADDMADEMADLRRRVLLPAMIRNPDWRAPGKRPADYDASEPKWIPNPEWIDPQAAARAMDSIKWEAGKRNPKKYGDRIEIDMKQDMTFEEALRRAQAIADALGQPLPLPGQPMKDVTPKEE